MAMQQAINTSEAPMPVGPYNQAVLAGEWLYCSGQVSIDPITGLMVGEGDVTKETQQVLKNLTAVISAAGGNISQIVRTTVFLTEMSDFELVNKIYEETFGGKVSPARACVQVAGLPKGAKVEIDCIAWIN